MIRRRNILRLAAITTLLAALWTVHRPRGAEASSEVPQHPVITRLVARDLTITITAGPRGPLYSAADRAGKPLASNLTLDELRAAHPDIHKHIDPAVCDTAPTIWAGTDRD